MLAVRCRCARWQGRRFFADCTGLLVHGLSSLVRCETDSTRPELNGDGTGRSSSVQVSGYLMELPIQHALAGPKQEPVCVLSAKLHGTFGDTRELAANLGRTHARHNRDRREDMTLRCPVCKEVELVMTERQTIEIDYCPICRGVWLDRGELDKIIERSIDGERGGAGRNSTEPHAPMADPRHQSGHHDHHDRQRHESHEWGHQGHRRSFWKDLFD
jgi:uncharacterized protein